MNLIFAFNQNDYVATYSDRDYYVSTTSILYWNLRNCLRENV